MATQGIQRMPFNQLRSVTRRRWTAIGRPGQGARSNPLRSDPRRPFRPGDLLLGKYRVERVLGQGGMGVVLSVRHLELDELFAVKLLLPQALERPGAADRFLREARVSARLKSEHSVRVFDVGHLDGAVPYMIMEHLHGVDLKGVLQARGSLPVAEAVAYLLEACDAVSEAHSQGIVHRDLKPANLFLATNRGGGARVKVIDFGISKEIAAEGADLTGTGTVLGSPFYMSPEQMMHAHRVDARSDVWSMGVVLYELVTGHRPFEGATVAELVGRVLHTEPPAPSEHRPELPRWVDALVTRCLRKAPEDRPQSIDELASAMRAHAGGAVNVVPDFAFAETLVEALTEEIAGVLDETAVKATLTWPQANPTPDAL